MISRLGLSRAAPKVSLLTLMLLISGATSVFVYPDPQTTLSRNEDPYYPLTDGPFELAQQILSLLEASRALVSATLDRLVDEGVVIPEAAEDVFRMGEEAKAQAYYYMEKGSYESVTEKATEALQLFGESLQIALEAQQEPTEDEDVVDASIVELRVRIERGYSRLSELYETMHQLEEKVLDVSDLQGLYLMLTNILLEKASEYLESASALLGEGALEAVASELATAEVYLDEAFKPLQTISDLAKSENASKFLDKTEERLDNLETRVSDIFGDEGLSSENFTTVQETVSENVQPLIDSGEVNSAINELEKVTNVADEVFEIIEDVDEGVANQLKVIEKLEAKKSLREEKIEDFKIKGLNATAFEEELQGIIEQLDIALENLETYKLEVAEEQGFDGAEEPETDLGEPEENPDENDMVIDESSDGDTRDVETVAEDKKSDEPQEEKDNEDGNDHSNEKMQKYIDKWKNWSDNVKKKRSGSKGNSRDSDGQG